MSTCISNGRWNDSRSSRTWTLCAFCFASLATLAEARAEIDWSGSLALTSDYLQQGLSQTRGEPALQGGMRAAFDERWTVGTWASSIDRYAGSDDTLEIDLYVARAWRIAPEWIASLTATHYFYPGDDRYVSYDYDELAASLGYRSMLFATVAWAPDYTDFSYRGVATDRSALSYELSAHQPIVGRWSGTAGVGYRDLSDLFDERYWYGHAGLILAAKHFTLHLTYTYVDAAARQLFGRERADIAWSGTVIWRFGAGD